MPVTPFARERFELLRFERKLPLGAPLTIHTLTGSTNDDALAAARAGAPHGATFVAEQQSQGRGRRGRPWFAANGESLLCSVLLRIPLPPASISLLALAAGLAVREAVALALPQFEEQGRVRVKWPNDVWVDGKKIAGVLAESQVQGGALSAAVVGFGVNVMTTVFPDDIAHSATSLAELGGVTAREPLLIDALSALEARMQRLLAGGALALAAELSQRDALVGHKVRVEGTEGVASGIDDQGRLLLRLHTQEIVAIAAGTVELVASADYTEKK
ncbi:MAG TPA: biotin--[acetyl-CoA-carboxylase] ligase [Polyangiaceae bacterium]|nr:biotin--[acetyl-CoA-carboxylase] ligase [Polyangiaceae bacterium]